MGICPRLLGGFWAVCINLCWGIRHNWDGWLAPRSVRWIGHFSVCLVAWIRASYPKVSDKTTMVLQNLYSLATFPILFILAIQMTDRAEPGMNYWLMALIGVVIPLLLHVGIVTVVTDWKKLLLAYLLSLTVLAFIGPGLPFLGGASLRLLGIGGSIPVMARIKSYGKSGTVSGAEEIQGCLILMTGTDLLIHPTNKRGDCKLHPMFIPHVQKGTASTYSLVDRYPSSDVLRISKFPELCATIDGLPDPSCSPDLSSHNVQ